MLALLAGVLFAAPGPVAAGGGRLAPVRDRYDPGQAATLVGYTYGAGVPDERFDAYLRPADEGAGARLLRSDVYVGELAVEETGHPGYLGLRVTLTFEVPAYLAPGDYSVVYCDDPCTGALLGDLVASPLSIGVDPGRPVVREWAPDEPELAHLAPGALVVGPGMVTAFPPPAPAPTPPEPAVGSPAPPAPLAPERMSWPLPTALVIGAAAGTGLLLTRSRRAPRPGSLGARPAPAGRG